MGQSLAKVSLTATMATLLQHFSFRLADEVRFSSHAIAVCVGPPAMSAPSGNVKGPLHVSKYVLTSKRGAEEVWHAWADGRG